MVEKNITKTKEKNTNSRKNRFPIHLGILCFCMVALTGGASAEVINVSQITGILTDMTQIFPSFGNLVVGITPTILTLAIIGFVIKFFDKILAMIDRFV